jgi:hypothetical protein
LTPTAEGPLCGVVRDVTFRGAQTVAVVAVDGAPDVEVHLSPVGRTPEVGARVCFAVDAAAVVVLPAEVGANLSE